MKHLRTLAHEMNTIIWIGQQGLSENVLQEIKSALNHHELIKIKIRAGDRESRDQITDEIREKTTAELIQKIGNVIVLYKRNEKSPKIIFEPQRSQSTRRK